MYGNADSWTWWLGKNVWGAHSAHTHTQQVNICFPCGIARLASASCCEAHKQKSVRPTGIVWAFYVRFSLDVINWTNSISCGRIVFTPKIAFCVFPFDMVYFILFKMTFKTQSVILTMSYGLWLWLLWPGTSWHPISDKLLYHYIKFSRYLSQSPPSVVLFVLFDQFFGFSTSRNLFRWLELIRLGYIPI